MKNLNIFWNTKLNQFYRCKDGAGDATCDAPNRTGLNLCPKWPQDQTPKSTSEIFFAAKEPDGSGISAGFPDALNKCQFVAEWARIPLEGADSFLLVFVYEADNRFQNRPIVCASGQNASPTATTHAESEYPHHGVKYNIQSHCPQHIALLQRKDAIYPLPFSRLTHRW